MIRSVTPEDRALYLQLADAFYHSEAVLHPVPVAYHIATFEEAIRSDEYLEAFILEEEGQTAGYALISKSFSPEVGGPIIWVEEVYLFPPMRGKGLGHAFFAFLNQRYGSTAKRLRLEVEPDNERAMALYKELGFVPLPYLQMVRDS